MQSYMNMNYILQEQNELKAKYAKKIRDLNNSDYHYRRRGEGNYANYNYDDENEFKYYRSYYDDYDRRYR